MKGITHKKYFILLLILVFFIISSATALNVDIQPPVNQNKNESETIAFSMLITGIPQQTSFIVLETDLESYNNTPLWNVSDSSQLGTNNASTLLMQKTLRLTPSIDLNKPINIKVSGKVPLIKQVSQYGGIIITNVERKSGYLYYRVQPYDSKGYPVGVGDTKTFNIYIDEEGFFDKINTVNDPEMKIIIQDLHNKGLWQESNRLFDYIKAQPAKVTLLIYIVSIVIVGFVLFVIGVRIGRARAKKPDDGTGELEMKEKV